MEWSSTCLTIWGDLEGEFGDVGRRALLGNSYDSGLVQIIPHQFYLFSSNLCSWKFDNKTRRMAELLKYSSVFS